MEVVLVVVIIVLVAIVVKVVVVVVVAASLAFVGVLVLGFEARVCMLSVKILASLSSV